MPNPFIQRMVNLEPRDFRTVRDFAIEKGLGRRAFSAALRLIIRDWAELRLQSAQLSTTIRFTLGDN